MHAIQPPRPSPQSVKPASTRAARLRRSRQQPRHAVVGAEVGAKLGVNMVVLIAAGAALIRLVPQNLAQQARLQELQTEVAFVERRVDQLQDRFNRHFDPQQTRAIMQEQSNRVDPNQRQVIWVAPAAPAAP